MVIFTHSIINHLNAVTNSKKIRAAYKSCLPLITKYTTELAQETKLYNAFNNIAESKQYRFFNSVQKRIIKNELLNFRLAGVSLSLEKKALFGMLDCQLRLPEAMPKDTAPSLCAGKSGE